MVDLTRNDHAALRERAKRLGRHSTMLASIVVMMVAMPFLEGLPGERLRFPILFGLVLLAAIRVNSNRRWVFWLALAIGVGALTGHVVADAIASTHLRTAADVASLVLLTSTTVSILGSVIRARQVDTDTIVGGVCAYLLIGFCFAVAFRLLNDMAPGSLAVGGVPLESHASDASKTVSLLIYYSFIALTTTGFGDVTPRSEIAQMLAVFEALIGQIYMTIFIARLMGLHVEAGRIRTDADDRSR